MGSFIHKVEAAINKAKKINHFHKSGQKIDSPKPDISVGKEQGEKVSFSELTNTRKLIPFIEKELHLTDPFNFTNETWARFTRNVIPKLIPALLLDMHIVPIKKRQAFIRYLEKRLRSLAKT